MNILNLELEDIWIRVRSPSADLINLLSQDFFHIIGSGSQKERISEYAAIEIEISDSFGRFEQPPGFRAFSFKEGVAYGWGRKRQVVYVDGASLELTHGLRKTAHMVVPSLARARELGGLLIHSLLGEAMEREGWVRVHGIGYKNANGDVHLLPAQSGAGKSTLALRILHSTDWSLISDEILWFKGNQVRGLPLHIAISEVPEEITLNRLMPKRRMRFGKKDVIELPANRILPSTPFDEITFTAVNPFVAWGVWIRQVVIGDGLPQMVEVFLRGPNLFFLTKMAFSRLRFAFKILLRGQLKVKPRLKYLSDVAFGSSTETPYAKIRI